VAVQVEVCQGNSPCQVFAMARPSTVEAFARFVGDTGYVTVAERAAAA
jgi:hypothetical protein